MSMGESPIDRFMRTQIEWKTLPAQNEVGGLPYATHEGVLQIGTYTLRCYQLSNGQRVIDRDDILNFLDMQPDERSQPIAHT